MSARAKMRVANIEEQRFAPGEESVTRFVNFSSCYDPTIPEDQRFQKATPWATARFQIDNPAALEQFIPGQDYYLDFTPVPKT